MNAEKYSFELPAHHKSIIKVIGVGGGGSNAVNHMFNQGIRDVEFVVCNTDVQALKSSPVPNKLQLGLNLTEGLGAGANPEKGKNAAIESKEDIREMLSKDTKMVFITAGMGGGTGTGAAPEIARVAKELGVLTVGIVTKPFVFEGPKKRKAAEAGIAELKQHCDTVIVILNDKLREIYGNLAISEAFAQADNVLTTAAKGIAEIITVPGYVNVDFEDVKTVMRNSGAAVMGSAVTEGEDRARRAAEEAISSPLLNNRNILGAQKILLSIISGEEAELQMDELSEITEFIQEKAGEEAEMIFGHGIDPSLGGSIRVTVIATGFEPEGSEKQASLPQMEQKKVIDLETNKQLRLDLDPIVSQQPAKESPQQRTYTFERPQPENRREQAAESNEKPTFLDIDGEFEIVSVNKEQASAIQPDEEAQDSVAEKRRELMEKARERAERLRQLGSKTYNESDEYKDKLDVPAYLRRNVRLKDVPHSSEKNVSRYNLTDDNQILGNNKYLHDNVD
jgi:cell division protein FtsZ